MKNFSKKDLKPFMRIKHRDGGVYIVCVNKNDGLFYTDGSVWGSLSSYYDNLTHNNNKNHDIVSVFSNDGLPTEILNINKCGDTLFKLEEAILELDGVEYSESTLRSLIKKATA